MPESYTPREFINKINADNPGPVFDPYGVEGLVINQDQSPGQDILAQAKVEAAKAKSPEGQVAELERQVEAMSQWLIQDATYTPEEVNNIIQSLKVEYNEEAQRAEVVGNLNLHSLTSAEGLTLPDSIGGWLDLSGLTYAERDQLRVQRPDLANKILPPDIM